jgi:hypothetical protein
MKDLLFIALILACPIAMAWMMSRGHGHGGAGGHSAHEHSSDASTDELRRRRDELARAIAAREHGDAPARDER